MRLSVTRIAQLALLIGWASPSSIMAQEGLPAPAMSGSVAPEKTAPETTSPETKTDETSPSATPEASSPRPLGPPPDVSKELKKPIYKKMSLTIGSPHSGRQVRAKKLRGDAKLHILKKGSDDVYGHPSLILMLHRSASEISKKYPGSKLVVGDLSSEDGGPLEGHHSHQSGRDADVLFYARDASNKEVLPKKFVQYDANGKATDGSGMVFDDERNWVLVDSWIHDKRAGVKYVFVARWLRTRLLAFALKHPKYKDHVQAAAAVFLQPEGAEPHDDHFHVRIRCPAGEEKICVD